ncbi:MAG: hypothetical protein ABI651_15995 [Verrucomicrobiota bacterium]
MRLSTPMRFLFVVVAVIFSVFFGFHLLFDRAREFRAQAQAGRPIVRAIDDYRTQTGSYPASFAALAPKHVSTVPDLPDEANHKFQGWDYRTVTNGVVVSYSLRYYMGRGGVDYDPPKWIGNDEGHKTVILTNQ